MNEIIFSLTFYQNISRFPLPNITNEQLQTSSTKEFCRMCNYIQNYDRLEEGDIT